MAGHNPLLIALMLINFAFFFLNQAFSFLNMSDFGRNSSFVLFNSSISDNSDAKYLEITPSSPTFSIWGVIYLWQILWMIYALVNVCRRTPDGPVYTNPTLLSPIFFAVSLFNWVGIIAWTFVWSWDHIWVAFVLLVSIFLSIYVLLGLSYKALADNIERLIKRNSKAEIWMFRVFVLNGLAIYGTWCTIATLLNLAMAMTYSPGPHFHQSTSSTVALSILTVELATFAVTDWTIMDKHSRYTITPYLVVITALTGSIVKNWNPMKTNSIFTAVLLGVAVVSFVVKVVLMIFRHCRDTRRSEMFVPITE